jgi:hypothetical protein
MRTVSVWKQYVAASIFAALTIKMSLRKVEVSYLELSYEPVCGALRDMLEKNSVLEELTLHCNRDSLLGGTAVASWHRTLPFLWDNKTLKSLAIIFNGALPHVGTLCIDTVAMLGYNDTLEVLDISSRGFSLNNYFSSLEKFSKRMSPSQLNQRGRPDYAFVALAIMPR